jgi:hypothetical protein
MILWPYALLSSRGVNENHVNGKAFIYDFAERVAYQRTSAKLSRAQASAPSPKRRFVYMNFATLQATTI